MNDCTCPDGRCQESRYYLRSSQSRHQAKVRGEKRIHLRIINRSTDYHPVQQDAFLMCADLFRHTDAGMIAKPDHDLDADQSQVLKSKARHKFRGTSGNSLSMTGCT